MSAQHAMMPGVSGSAFTIRDEEPHDREAVRGVAIAAFGGAAEADLVERLYDDGDVLFGLVADAGGRIVGHILFSRLPIETVLGAIAAAALAPLAVLPVWQGRGVGSALVRHGLDRCQKRRIPAVVVLGDPGYYGRFGFRAETARGLRTPWPGPYLLALELVGNGLGDGVGVARYAPAFEAVP